MNAYRIVKVRALPGGGEACSDVPMSFPSRVDALNMAEKLQADFLNDAEPVQLYVVDSTGARVYRAEGNREFGKRRQPDGSGFERLGSFARARQPR